MHNLRPNFNKKLLRLLREGRSINLVGRRGSGCSRCLEEIQFQARQEGYVVILIDMNHHKYNFQGLLEAVAYQWHEQMKGPEDFNDPIPVLTSLDGRHLAELLMHGPLGDKGMILLLDHFDAILDNPQQRLPKSFYDDLNSLKNRDRLTLCCVSERPQLQYRIHYLEGEELKDRLSWLDLQVREITDLTETQIRDWLNSKLADHPRWATEEPQLTRYVQLLSGHHHPVQLMEVIEANWDQVPAGTKTEVRLKQITKKYREYYGNKPSLEKPKNYGPPKWFKEWLSIFNPFKS